ncbi:MAG TPA: signal peptide peptidase SppA [Bacteroidia bacterium]|nr:signal peptide peptidase SppA [Bacteroidia bacterium]
MKQFFGAFFGSILGLIIATGLVLIVIVGVIKTSIGSGFKQDKEETSQSGANSILKIEMGGPIQERQKQNPFRKLNISPFGDDDQLALNTLTKKIVSAQSDKNIKGIYLTFKDLEGGFATVEDLRNTLKAFKKSGKFIYSYSENFGQLEYYLASVSDKIFVNPQGNIDWKGLSMQRIFFKHAFEKLDLEVQVFRHGKFKSAVEPFLLDKMSEANRFQSETYLNSIWNTMLTGISENRKISFERLNAMANQLEIRYPEDAVGNLIDAVYYEDEVIAELKKKIGLAEKDKMKFTDLGKYTAKSSPESKTGAGKIALIYAVGQISGGEGDDESIGSDRLAKSIKEARLDDKIKAIVLRVNSPGGSALASDVIWREMVLAKKAKPTIVSMGDVAASGGYYISCGADRIFAEPNTITGSIGVFGLIPNLQKMLEKKLGITVDTVNTNKYSDVASGLRSISDYEYSYIQNSVERVYDTFTKRVAEGRKMSQADVDSIGQGRVWTGADALKINLVDELGGVQKAIAYAAKKAGLKDFKVVELPKQKSPFDAFMGNKESELETRIIKNNLGPTYLYFKQIQNVMSLKGIQTRLPFDIFVE